MIAPPAITHDSPPTLYASLHRIVDRLVATGCTMRWLGETRVRATCPGHADSHPSLALDWRAGRVLLKDFGGCTTATILRALQLTPADLFDERQSPSGAGPARVIAHYEYVDTGGTCLARKCRTDPKGFFWERPGSDSGWRRGLRGITLTPFSLIWIVDARRVFVTEGEKGVLALRERGLAAVCPPCGATCWRPGWSEALWRCGARELLVLSDADVAGRAHAARVAAACYHYCPPLPLPIPDDDPWPDVALQPGDPEAEALTVKLIDLPGLDVGQDVFDWLTVHQHTAADLCALANAAAPWSPPDPLARRRALTRRRVQRFRQRRAVAQSEEMAP